MEKITPAQQLALWADELRHISAMGARFSQDRYDQDNYARFSRKPTALVVG